MLFLVRGEVIVDIVICAIVLAACAGAVVVAGGGGGGGGDGGIGGNSGAGTEYRVVYYREITYLHARAEYT